MRTRSLVRRAAATLAALPGLALIAPAAFAQDPDESDAGRGYFQIGYIGLDLDDLNDRLVGSDYPELGGSFLTLGGGGYGERGRLLIGGEGHAVLGSDEDTADGGTKLSISGGYGLFRLGYVAFSGDGADIVPALGIGGGIMTLDLVDRDLPTFDEVIEDPERSSRLSTGMFLLDLSVALHYRITREGDDEEGPRGLLVGVQGGYAFAPGDTSWTLDEVNDVSGGPQLQIEGLHVRVSIGGWRGGR